MRYVTCPTSQKAAKLHHFTFTTSNYYYRLLSRCDTKINSHCTVCPQKPFVLFLQYFFVADEGDPNLDSDILCFPFG